MDRREITSWLLLALATWIGSCCKIEVQKVEYSTPKQPHNATLIAPDDLANELDLDPLNPEWH